MEKMVGVIGNVSAIVGILLAFGAGLARVLGLYLMSGYTTMTLFQVGTGLMGSMWIIFMPRSLTMKGSTSIKL